MSNLLHQASTRHAVCTTPYRDRGAAVPRALQLARWFDIPYIERNQRSLERLISDEQVDVVVVADAQLSLYHRDDVTQPVFFHPGMAMQRIRNLMRDERDRMIEVCKIRAGDTVLDATLGMASDSLVASYVVGSSGRVIGLECSWFLARMLQWSQREAAWDPPQVQSAFERIDIMYTDHLSYLRMMNDNSVDVVLFDPMFRVPTKSISDISHPRPLTVKSPLSMDAWKEAKRVARRAVVLKERPGHGQLERFGVIPDKPRTRFAYGVWWKAGVSIDQS